MLVFTIHSGMHRVVLTCCVFMSLVVMASSGGHFPSSAFLNCPHASATATVDWITNQLLTTTTTTTLLLQLRLLCRNVEWAGFGLFYDPTPVFVCRDRRKTVMILLLLAKIWTMNIVYRFPVDEGTRSYHGVKVCQAYGWQSEEFKWTGKGCSWLILTNQPTPWS
jgi:hypothetical protein